MHSRTVKKTTTVRSSGVSQEGGEITESEAGKVEKEPCDKVKAMGNY